MGSRRRSSRRGPDREDEPEEPELAVVDLHGLAPDAALRRVAQSLHAARVRGAREFVVVTGRGLSNPTGEAVLRGKVEAWLRGPEARGQGVKSFEREARGGALRVRL